MSRKVQVKVMRRKAVYEEATIEMDINEFYGSVDDDIAALAGEHDWVVCDEEIVTISAEIEASDDDVTAEDSDYAAMELAGRIKAETKRDES